VGRDTGARVIRVRPSDTVRVTLQPSATIIVEPQGESLAVFIGVVTVLLLAGQLWIMNRQTDAMNRQTSLLGKQTELSVQQAAWQRDEAIGTFYRIGLDLVAEFKKANVLPTVKINPDYSTHPRQMLREASRLFAPLGNKVVMALNHAALSLDTYFSEAEAHDRHPSGGDVAEHWQNVQRRRVQVGVDLDEAVMEIPPELRWKFPSGDDFTFRPLCEMPPDLANRVFGGPNDEEASPKHEET
jgi:hypothetical protein